VAGRDLLATGHSVCFDRAANRLPSRHRLDCFHDQSSMSRFSFRIR
jgi:hypothetical protein